MLEWLCDFDTIATLAASHKVATLDSPLHYGHSSDWEPNAASSATDGLFATELDSKRPEKFDEGSFGLVELRRHAKDSDPKQVGLEPKFLRICFFLFQ